MQKVKMIVLIKPSHLNYSFSSGAVGGITYDNPSTILGELGISFDDEIYDNKTATIQKQNGSVNGNVDAFDMGECSHWYKTTVDHNITKYSS